MTAPFTADDKTAGAGTAENAAKSGVAAILAKDSDEAIAKAKQLLSVLPANNLETAGNDYYMEMMRLYRLISKASSLSAR